MISIALLMYDGLNQNFTIQFLIVSHLTLHPGYLLMLSHFLY